MTNKVHFDEKNYFYDEEHMHIAEELTDKNSKTQFFIFPLFIEEIEKTSKNAIRVDLDRLKYVNPNILKTLIKLKNNFELSHRHTTVINVSNGHVQTNIEPKESEKYIIFVFIGYYMPHFIDTNNIRQALSDCLSSINTDQPINIKFNDELLSKKRANQYFKDLPLTTDNNITITPVEYDGLPF